VTVKRKRKPFAWSGPCGTVWCDIEEDGARTVHVAIPHAILTGKCCRRLAAWLGRAAEWVEDTREVTL
jgi:hypothetical protein